MFIKKGVKKFKTCANCGKLNLIWWESLEGQWRLIETNIDSEGKVWGDTEKIHLCKSEPKNSDTIATVIPDMIVAPPLITKSKKPSGYWKSPVVIAQFNAILSGIKNVGEVAKELGFSPERIARKYKQWAGLETKKKPKVITAKVIHFPPVGPFTASEAPDEQVLPLKKALGAKAPKEVQGVIDWARFFELPKPEHFDLRIIAAMFYASNKLTDAKLGQNELFEIKDRSRKFVALWAERFGKYLLAACLGEYRHRHVAGELDLVPKGNTVSRAVCQKAAERIWPDKNASIQATLWMGVKFADPRYFTQNGNVGGLKWASIAKTVHRWLNSEIPDMVFMDYCWDLQHNNGVLFDKCKLFKHEGEVRSLMRDKKKSKSSDVREWGGRFLHPDWLTGLNMLEALENIEKEQAKLVGWIGNKLVGQPLYGGD